MRDQRDGSYALAFTPTSSGRHALAVTLDKRPVVGSPFELHVSAPLPEPHADDDDDDEAAAAAAASQAATAASATAADADESSSDDDDAPTTVESDAERQSREERMAASPLMQTLRDHDRSAEAKSAKEAASVAAHAPANSVESDSVKSSDSAPSPAAAADAAFAPASSSDAQAMDEDASDDDAELILFGDESDDDAAHEVSVQARRFIEHAAASGLAKLASETEERDIEAEESDDEANEDYDIVVLSESARFRVGFAETQGPRPTMEDAMVVYGQFREHADEDMFGVFDGHGGDEASDVASDFLYEALESAMDRLDGEDEEASGGGVSQLANASSAEADALVSAALKESFVKTHREIVSEERGIECGTTALVAYARQNKLYVANVGDSRAVVAYRDGRVERVTRDHKSTDEEEMKAVTERGGFVVRGRVMGMIAIARALGDKSLADYLGHEPDVFVRDLDDIEIIILACDGIWDVLSDEEAMRIARSTRNPRKMAERLRNTAIDRQSRDNVSVLCICTQNANRPNDD